MLKGVYRQLGKSVGTSIQTVATMVPVCHKLTAHCWNIAAHHSVAIVNKFKPYKLA